MGKNIREQFIPSQKLDFLQIDGTIEGAKSRIKVPRHFEAAVIRMGLPVFERGIEAERAVQIFERIAEQVEQAMPSFIKWGGMVDRFVEGGVQLLFMNNEDCAMGAVGAAIQVREELLKDEEMWKGMTFGMTYGHVILGVIGGVGQYNVMSMSHEAAIAKFLQRAAAKYSASILAGERLMERDPAIRSKYSCRLLGKFYFSAIKKSIKVYDLYDGDEISVRTAKRKTALLFDKGVSLFLAEDFVQARSYFIEVLKANRTDKAARTYLSLCDNFRENPPESPEDLCIERV